MAEVSILARKESKYFLTRIDTDTETRQKFDVSIEEEHGRESELTELPVSNGYVISDHLIFKPETLSVEGLITETPLKLLGGAISDAIGDKVDLSNAWKNVEKLWREGALLKINTGLQVYNNMVCVGLSVPRDATTGHSIRIKANFKELRTSQTEIVNLDSNLQQGDDNLAAVASAQKDKGKVTPETTFLADAGQAFLNGLKNLGTGLF